MSAYYRNDSIRQKSINYSVIYKLFYINYCNKHNSKDSQLFDDRYNQILSKNYQKEKKYYDLINKHPTCDYQIWATYIIKYQKKIKVDKYSLNKILALLATNIKVIDYFVFDNEKSRKKFIKNLILTNSDLFFKAYNKDKKILKKLSLSFG